MQDLLVVTVLHGECDLGEPVEELILSHVVFPTLAIDSLEALLDFALQVTIVGIVHHNAQLALFGLVHLTETHNVGMVQHLQNFGLVKGLAAFLFAHLCDVDLLDDSVGVVRKTLHQVGSSKGANTESADLLVGLEILCGFFSLNHT